MLIDTVVDLPPGWENIRVGPATIYMEFVTFIAVCIVCIICIACIVNYVYIVFIE